ncbi:ion transporter [Mycobacterium paraense]|uniref:ion transporter n=1 Tax=Mycobacterium paraense TaxID=767916 RepID=UPI0014824267|nr:ion transporter [Mycobacterium paraense]
MANAGLLVAGMVVHGHERAFEAVHAVIVVLFMVELVARLAADGWQFFSRPFNGFDTVVILVSALPLVGVDASLLRLARVARLMHLARHAAHLRLLRTVRFGRR